jgi:hypothetical protein
MLAPTSLQKQFASGLVETACPRCGQEGEVSFGEVCINCQRDISRRAKRIARWGALLSTGLVGLYAHWRLPDDQTARMVGAVSVLMWYALSYTVASRAARHLLR